MKAQITALHKKPMSNRDIATELGISRNIVNTYLKNGSQLELQENPPDPNDPAVIAAIAATKKLKENAA